MVANWMHRNLGKSNSIFSSESVGIICQKGDSLKKKKKERKANMKMPIVYIFIPLAGYPGVRGSPAPFRFRTFPLWAPPPGRFQPSG